MCLLEIGLASTGVLRSHLVLNYIIAAEIKERKGKRKIDR